MGAASVTRLSQPGPLELRAVGETSAHFLDGEPVAAGETLELLLRDGLWLRGRYEWSGFAARWPALRVELGGPWESPSHEGFVPAAVLALHPDATLRRAR